MTIEYLGLLLFGFSLYFIITDPNVAEAFVYFTRYLRNKFNGKFWWFINDPKNPIVKYFMWRRSMKMAKELREKIDTYYKNLSKEVE
jgi:hypothetical protein